MKAKLVTRAESTEARQRAAKLIEDVRKHPKIDRHYKFFHRPIGSGKRRCIVKDANGKYDLDYQIVLTINSKNGDKNPSQIKSDFFQAFLDSIRPNEIAENSTTVVTIRASKSEGVFDSTKQKFSFDFVIISIDELHRIRRNGPNEFTWVQLPSKNSCIYEKFNGLSADKRRVLLEEYVIPRVINEKCKDESIRTPSVHIFCEEVNNFVE